MLDYLSIRASHTRQNHPFLCHLHTPYSFPRPPSTPASKGDSAAVVEDGAAALLCGRDALGADGNEPHVHPARVKEVRQHSLLLLDGGWSYF